MRGCEHFEMEISALIDGECPPRQVRAVVDHLADCPTCVAIYREMRTFQQRVDRTPLAPEAAVSVNSLRGTRTPSPTPLPVSVRRYRPRWWTWSIAAVVLLAVGMGVTGRFPVRVLPAAEPGANEVLAVELEREKGRMTDERFLELALEILSADRKYQRTMADVIHRAWRPGTRTEESGESLSNTPDEQSPSLRNGLGVDSFRLEPAS